MNVNYLIISIGPNRIHETQLISFNCKNSLEYLNWVPKYDFERNSADNKLFTKTAKLFMKSEMNFKKIYILHEKI